MQEAKKGLTGPLTRDRIVEEALAVVDEDSFTALSLRAVARRLGVTPMALYRYVKSSDELGDLVVSRILSERATGLQWPADPRTALEMLATTVLELVRSHPAMLERYEQRGVFTPPAVRIVEALLEILVAAGLSGEQAVLAYSTVHFYALGFAAQSSRPMPLEITEVPDPSAFPVLAANLEAWRGMRDESHFRAGLDVVITAVLASPDRPRRGRRAARS